MSKSKKKENLYKHGIINQQRYEEADNNLAMSADIYKRHEKPYLEDPQIDYMYSRHAKKKKSKLKPKEKFVDTRKEMPKVAMISEIELIVISNKKNGKLCGCKK